MLELPRDSNVLSRVGGDGKEMKSRRRLGSVNSPLDWLSAAKCYKKKLLKQNKKGKRSACREPLRSTKNDASDVNV